MSGSSPGSVEVGLGSYLKSGSELGVVVGSRVPHRMLGTNLDLEV